MRQKIAAIYLLTETYGKNEMDDPITTLTERKVIGRLKSVRQSEHWQASAAGFKPELVFVIRDFDFKGEKQVRYNGDVYTVLRMDDSRGIEIELICSKEVNTTPEGSG